MTSSKDKSIKIWKLPQQWHNFIPLGMDKGPHLAASGVSKLVEENKEIKAELFSEMKTESKQEGKSEDKKEETAGNELMNEDAEEEDDLSGWAK